MADARRTESTADRPTGDERTPELDDPLGFAVVTVSEVRTIEEDEPTAEIVSAVEAADHEVAVRERIDASHDNVQSAVSRLVDRDDVDLVVTAGSAGIDPSDVTIEAVRPILGKDLPTFSHLFATLSIERIGTRAIAGRTEAGIVDDVPVFCLPGHAEATRLAIRELIEPEAVRLVAEARDDDAENGD